MDDRTGHPNLGGTFGRAAAVRNRLRRIGCKLRIVNGIEAQQFRTETDSLGEVRVPARKCGVLRHRLARALQHRPGADPYKLATRSCPAGMKRCFPSTFG